MKSDATPAGINRQSNRLRRAPFLGAAFASCCLSLAAHAQQATPVAVEAVQTAPLVNKLELSGTVTSPRVSEISTAVPGLIESVHFDSGAHVKKGDLLLELDPALEEMALKEAETETAQAEAELKDAQRRLAISENLAKREIGPQNTVDERKTEIEIDTVAVERNKAKQARIAERLDRHLVKAPYAGVISKRMAEVGEWVVPGTPVFELVEMQGLRIDLPVPQQYYSQLQHGANVTLMFDAIPGKEVPATIGALIPVSDPDVRTFTLRVLPTSKVEIAPGMSARVAIELEPGQKGVVVNRDALVRYPDGRTTVWVLETDGDETTVKEQPVEIGLSFKGLVQVRSGLKEGDRVVVRGNESLREGQSVRLAS